VVDCAHGAAYKLAPAVLWELGAEVIAMGVHPDGKNINQGCGAMFPQAMQEQVVIHGADIGIALDGDADRLILSDEHGTLVDGDQIMALIALAWQQSGQLRGGGIAATVMSNLGLERLLAQHGLSLHRAPVGDRYVVEKMLASGCNLGGEQSGHIVLHDFNSTGDGLMAALQVLAVLVLRGEKASAALNCFTPVPQKLASVRVTGAVLEQPPIQQAIQAAQSQLGQNGRLLVRKSGTEPLIRVMAEGDDEAMVQRIVNELCAQLKAAA